MLEHDDTAEDAADTYEWAVAVYYGWTVILPLGLSLRAGLLSSPWALLPVAGWAVLVWVFYPRAPQ